MEWIPTCGEAMDRTAVAVAFSFSRVLLPSLIMGERGVFGSTAARFRASTRRFGERNRVPELRRTFRKSLHEFGCQKSWSGSERGGELFRDRIDKRVTARMGGLRRANLKSQ